MNERYIGQCWTAESMSELFTETDFCMSSSESALFSFDRFLANFQSVQTSPQTCNETLHSSCFSVCKNLSCSMREFIITICCALFEAIFYFVHKEKILHILKTFWRSSHIAPFSKQNNMSIEQLYSLKGYAAEGAAILALQQKTHILKTGFCIINGI